MLELRELVKDCYDKGFNVYACINKVKKDKKWRIEVPDEVVERVCRQYLAEKDSVKSAWPWFLKVFAMESQAYFATQQIREHERIKAEEKKSAYSLKEILQKVMQ